MKDLSIIIVTYNSQADIVNCIDSIIKNCDIPSEQLEIIVIDNSSESVYEETKKLISTNFSQKIAVYHNSTNGGYGQGNNVGIQKASANIVLISNPDLLFTKPIFKKALEIFQRDRKLAMIGGKQLGGQNISFWIRPEFDFFIITAPLSIILNKLNYYSERFFYLSGALLFIDKAKFAEIGYFDERMFMYCEEADITKRFLQKNYSTKYIKNFEYRHLIDDRNEASEKSISFLLRSYKIYFEKFKISYKSFIWRKTFSSKLLMYFGKFFGNKEIYNRNREYLRIFEEN